MTKKHFKAIAERLNTMRLEGMPLDKWDTLVTFQVSICRDLNPRFDVQRFTDACNGRPYKK